MQQVSLWQRRVHRQRETAMWRQRGNCNYAAASQRTPSAAGICQKLRRGEERVFPEPFLKSTKFQLCLCGVASHFLGQDLSPKGEYRVSLIAFLRPWPECWDSKTGIACFSSSGVHSDEAVLKEGWPEGGRWRMRRWGYGPERWPQLKSRNVHWMSAVGQHIKNNSLYLHSSQFLVELYTGAIFSLTMDIISFYVSRLST